METKTSGVLIPSISAILVLDNTGKRIGAKYYSKDLATDAKAQSALEKKLHSKTNKATTRVDAEVLLLEKWVVLYKVCNDAFFYVLSASEENELVVLAVLTALEETMQNLLRNSVSKKSLDDNLDLLLLAIDEIVDDGTILETDCVNVTSRVAMRGADKDVPISEQTFSQALQQAKDQLVRSFR